MTATPAQLFAKVDLETALTGEKLKQLLAVEGKPEATPARVQMVIDHATGFVFGKIQIALKLKSIDEAWANIWTERDKAELRRLAIGAGVYYAHFIGQKGEEVPESVQTELDRIEKRCTEIAEHTATLGNEPTAASSTQHDFVYGTGAGHSQVGSPRRAWRGL